MTMTDPIAAMLTKIRNAARQGHSQVDIPASRLKKEIARLLKSEGFIDNYTAIEDNRQGKLRIYLRYGPERISVIRNIKRISTPGRRVYVGKGNIPMVMGGKGMAIVSTSRGVFSDREARKSRMGGEVICHVW